jgi:hypothetical protein
MEAWLTYFRVKGVHCKTLNISRLQVSCAVLCWAQHSHPKALATALSHELVSQLIFVVSDRCTQQVKLAG